MGAAVHCHATSNESPAIATTTFAVLASSPRWRGGNVTENFVRMKYSVAGKFTKLIAVVLTNGTTTASTIDFRKNGASGANALTIGAGATGTFEDNANTDLINAGDLVNLRIVPGAVGVLAVRQLGMLFEATGARTVTKLACCNSEGLGTPGSTSPYPLVGGTGTDTEVRYQLKLRTQGTLKVFHLYVDSNTRSDTSTIRLRKNGANGNQTFNVGAAATGLFEDVTNVDEVLSGDLVNLNIVLGGGTGSLGIITWGVELHANDRATMWANSQATTTWAAGATEFLNPLGNFTLKSATEADVQFKPRIKARLSGMALYVLANATSTSSTITLRDTSVDMALAITIGAGVTGAFENIVNIVDVEPTDLLNWKGVIGATGTLNLSMLSVRVDNMNPESLFCDDDSGAYFAFTQPA